MTRFCLSLSLLLSSLPFASAQDLQQHTSFFEKQLVALNEWLRHSGIPPSALEARKIKVEEELVSLFLTTANLASWKELNAQSLADSSRPFYMQLFEKFRFLADLRGEELSIEIEAKDGFIFIDFQMGDILVSSMEKMAVIEDEHAIPLNELALVDYGESVNADNTFPLQALKTRIERALRKYFQRYEAWFEDYEFTVVSTLGDDLVLEVNNVIDVILDEGYFEHIRIAIEFNEQEADLNLKFTIAGKYGAGIIWAPKNSDYYDMDPKYGAQLREFSLLLKNQLNNILRK